VLLAADVATSNVLARGGAHEVLRAGAALSCRPPASGGGLAAGCRRRHVGCTGVGDGEVLPRAGEVLGVLPLPAEAALSAAADSKSVVLEGAGKGADVADVVSRREGADVANVVSRARVVLGLLSQTGGGLMPAAGPPSWWLCRRKSTLCRAREGCCAFSRHWRQACCRLPPPSSLYWGRRGQPRCRATRRGRGARRVGGGADESKGGIASMCMNKTRHDDKHTVPIVNGIRPDYQLVMSCTEMHLFLQPHVYRSTP